MYGLDELLTKSINGSGFNPDYGLLGSNTATDTTIKLFPKGCQEVVESIQGLMRRKPVKI